MRSNKTLMEPSDWYSSFPNCSTPRRKIRIHNDFNAIQDSPALKTLDRSLLLKRLIVALKSAVCSQIFICVAACTSLTSIKRTCFTARKGWQRRNLRSQDRVGPLVEKGFSQTRHRGSMPTTVEVSENISDLLNGVLFSANCKAASKITCSSFPASTVGRSDRNKGRWISEALVGWQVTFGLRHYSNVVSTLIFLRWNIPFFTSTFEWGVSREILKYCI